MSLLWATVHHGIEDLRTRPESPFALPLTRIADSVLQHVPAGITRGSSASAVESLVICRVVAKDRTLLYPLNRRVGTNNLTTGHHVTETTVRETLCRPGHHPHRSIRTSFGPLSSSHITSTSSAQSQDIDIIPFHLQSKICTETCASYTDRQDMESQEVLSQDAEEQQSSTDMDQDTDRSHTTIRPVGKSVDWSVSVDNQQTDKDITQISGVDHWFLEGWIGDHVVDFLVDSGSAVTAVSRSFYETLSEAGASVGDLRPMVRRLRGANGSQINIYGCSSCVVSFLGLRTEFPILVCDLSTDAIIGTDTLGSILPHTLDIRNGLLFMEGGVLLQLHRRDAALSGCIFTVGHCSIPPHSEAVLHCTTRTVGGRSLPPSGLLEGLTFFVGKYRPGGRPDIGGPIGMEGPCVGV